MTRDQFLERLRASRLLTPEQLRDAAGRYGAGESPAAFADALTADGLLTPFQARRLLTGAGGPLVLGQYRLLDELGQGGMGQVFKARHTVMGRVVALKVLSEALQGQAVAQGWFEREVRTLTQLHHPSIVLAHDANEAEGVRYLVMEYVEGQNLQCLVRDRGPLPVALACAMMAEAAGALQYAHDKGLVHRDLKPANLLVPADALAYDETCGLSGGGKSQTRSATDDEPPPRAPLVKIVDFGLARLRAPGAADTIMLQSPDHFAGTPDFAAPEQCRDIHAADIRSDLYSLGCTFYFALTGRPPFGGKSLTEKLANHLMEPPPDVTRLRQDAPAAVAAILLRLMAKDPDQRFQTPAALAKALRPWCEAPASVTPQAPPLSEGLARLHADASPTAVSPPGGGTKAAMKTRAVVAAEQAAAPAVAPGVAAVKVGAGEEDAASEAGAAPESPRGEPDMRVLRAGWRRWTDLIAALCDRRGPGGWDDLHYRRLHESLLAACRRGAAGSPEKGAPFRRLEEIVGPWVSLESLERTEPELLQSLLSRSVQAEKALGVRRPLRRLGGFLRTYAAPVLAVWLLVQGGAAAWRLASAGVGRANLHTLLGSLQLDSTPGQVSLLLPLIALTAILLVKK